MGFALESEKDLQRTARADKEAEQLGTSTKGAILATTTGMPSFPAAQAFGGGNTTAPSSVSASGVAVSPPPAAVVVTVSGAGAGTGSAQSGGLNSNGLLKQILNEIGKGAKGKDKK